MPPARRELAIGLSCAVGIVCIWTTFLLTTRFSAKGAFSAWDLMALRFGISGLLMLPLVLRRGLAGLSPWQALVLMATAGPVFSLSAFSALALAPAAHAGVLMPGTLPLWTAILTAVVMHQSLSRRQSISLALVLAGVAMIGWESIAGEAAAAASPLQWLGDVLFMTASFSWAIYTVLARRWGVRPLDAAAVVCVTAGAAYMPVYLLALPITLHLAPAWEIAVQAVLQGVISTIGTLLLFTRAAQALGAPTLTLVTSIVPAFVALLAVPLLGEPLTLAAGLGVALVVLGIAATVGGLRALPAGR
ncbi:MAG: DMT family transporter [Alphaproteobacteria bacterium]|nr:DMT family transporter [Alphaproteobacteria bacterium]